MRISEIAQLKSQSPALRMALHQRDCYHFLREQVKAWDAYSADDTCSHCGRAIYPKLMHPYAAPDIGWCIDCVLGAYFSDAPRYEPPEKPRPKAYYFVYEDGQGWKDQDGNPVAELPFRFP